MTHPRSEKETTLSGTSNRIRKVRSLTVAALISWGLATQTALVVNAQTGNGYDLTWSTIDSGGEMFSTGNGYELGGTIGQADAGELTGGTYAVTGGFWSVGIPCVCQLYADIIQSCVVDVDDLICLLNGFAVFADCPAGDLAPCGGSGLIDVDDLISLLEAFSGNYLCPHPCPP
ncbi:MAG: hypothetical protein AABZ47_11300 [Planctomycetota bacterium]